ncbi:MAG: hypothetical protein V4773_26765 [Verrucomicrobiota bacterium]
MNHQQILEMVGMALCFVASIAGTFYVMASFPRWCCSNTRTVRIPHGK